MFYCDNPLTLQCIYNVSFRHIGLLIKYSSEGRLPTLSWLNFPLPLSTLHFFICVFLYLQKTQDQLRLTGAGAQLLRSCGTTFLSFSLEACTCCRIVLYTFTVSACVCVCCLPPATLLCTVHNSRHQSELIIGYLSAPLSSLQRC